MPGILEPIPLPTTFDHGDADVAEAYAICLVEQERAGGLLEQAVSDTEKQELERNLVYIRVLGYLLFFAPTLNACKNVALEVLAAARAGAGGDALWELGKHYFRNFVRLFYREEDRYAYLFSDGDGCNVLIPGEDKLASWEDANHFQMRYQAFVRDDFQSVIGGHFDVDAVLERKLVDESSFGPSSMPRTLICVHILPDEVFHATVEESGDDGVDAIWSTLEKLSLVGLRQEFPRDRPCPLKNVICLNIDSAFCFNTLRAWLDPTDVPGQFEVGVYTERIRDGPRKVSFTSRDECILPDARLLQLHALAAKVGLKSGALWLLLKARPHELFEDAEGGLVSATVLSARLWYLDTQPAVLARPKAVAPSEHT